MAKEAMMILVEGMSEQDVKEHITRIMETLHEQLKAYNDIWQLEGHALPINVSALQLLTKMYVETLKEMAFQMPTVMPGVAGEA
jgi:hypothetical protein